MAVINPIRNKNERKIPECGLLLVNPAEAASRIERMLAQGARRQFLFNSGLVIEEKAGFFLAGPAVGAPAAVMALEKLVALGARQLVLCGWCGAVSPSLAIGDVVVPDIARIGEGTSQYYGRKKTSAPSQPLSAKLYKKLENAGLPVQRGCVWSTDGIYREDRQLLLSLYEEHSVVAVDMEFSALCSAAAFRGIDFAGSLVVSDITTDECWQPGFGVECFRNNKERILELLLENGARIGG